MNEEMISEEFISEMSKDFSHYANVEQRTIDFYAKENIEFFSKYKNLVSYYSDEEEISYNKNLEDDYSDGNRIL